MDHSVSLESSALHMSKRWVFSFEHYPAFDGMSPTKKKCFCRILANRTGILSLIVRQRTLMIFKIPRLYNLFTITPLIVWYGLGLSWGVSTFMQHFYALSMNGHVAAPVVLQLLAQAIVNIFLFFLILLLIVRDVPRSQVAGIVPYTVAMLGTFATTSFLFLPVVTPSIAIFVVSTLCIIIGFGLSLYTLIYLGSSFALLPSARHLVTEGPYRFVRHPLYLSEEIAIIGIMIQFKEPWSVLVVIIHAAAQFTRMNFEEHTLTKAFPAYATYAMHTSQIIPGIY